MPKQKSITDKTIAELHGVKIKHIRELLNRNKKQFENAIDYIDLKSVVLNDRVIDLGYSKQSIANSANIYLLSERGYMKLIKIMDN